jgi:hypothetical protein
MTRFRSAQGKASLAGILTLAVIVFMVYEAFKFAPPLVAQYEFRDAMVEEAKFSLNKDAVTIQNSLAKKAAELGLEIPSGQIRVTREPTRTIIQVKYRQRVEWLPGQVYTWDVNELEESVLF